MYYRQCKLRKATGPKSHQIHVAWIPDRYAVVGKFIQLKNPGGGWDDGWFVEKVWSWKSDEEARADAREYVHHRDRTDV